MTLRDLFTNQSIWTVYGDMDVVNDCIDDYAPAWCGTLLTDEGQKHFDLLLDTYEPLLDTEIEVGKNMCGSFVECKINDCPDYDKRWNAIKELLECSAGYCSCEDYDNWFVDDCINDDDQLVRSLIPEGSEDEDALDRIAVLEARLEVALGYILDHICKEDIPQFVKTIKEA